MNKLLVISTICSVVFSNPILASGFQLYEQSATGVGNYRAGGSASANEASTAFFNAAGLTEIHKKEYAVTTVAISTKADFNGQTQVDHKMGDIAPVQGTTSIKGLNLVPSFQYAYPINDRLTYGFDVGVPFGLSTEWDRDSFVSYAATESSIEVVNIGNSIGYKINDQLSLGAGVDVQHMKGIFNLQGDIFGAMDVSAVNEVSGWGVGWHTGMLYKFNDHARLGLSYRSAVHQKGKGPSQTDCYRNCTDDYEVKTSTASVDVHLPASSILSYFHTLNDHVDLMASLYYTQWSKIKELTVYNSAALQDPENITNATNYQDVFSIALGINYHLNNKWSFTAGTGYDQTPTTDEYRDLRLPDANRFALAFGTSYAPSDRLKLTFGYTQLFVNTVKIDSTSSAGKFQDTYVKGDVDGTASIVGIQFNYSH